MILFITDLDNELRFIGTTYGNRYYLSMGEIAPAFDQIGGGTQYKLPSSIIYLINNGYLEEIL